MAWLFVRRRHRSRLNARAVRRRIMAAAMSLRDFDVRELARFAGVPERTVEAFVTRYAAHFSPVKPEDPSSSAPTRLSLAAAVRSQTVTELVDSDPNERLRNDRHWLLALRAVQEIVVLKLPRLDSLPARRALLAFARNTLESARAQSRVLMVRRGAETQLQLLDLIDDRLAVGSPRLAGTPDMSYDAPLFLRAIAELGAIGEHRSAAQCAAWYIEQAAAARAVVGLAPDARRRLDHRWFDWRSHLSGAISNDVMEVRQLASLDPYGSAH